MYMLYKILLNIYARYAYKVKKNSSTGSTNFIGLLVF